MTGKTTVHAGLRLHAVVQIIAVTRPAGFKTKITIMTIVNIVAIRTVLHVPAVDADLGRTFYQFFVFNDKIIHIGSPEKQV